MNAANAGMAQLSVSGKIPDVMRVADDCACALKPILNAATSLFGPHERTARDMRFHI